MSHAWMSHARKVVLCTLGALTLGVAVPAVVHAEEGKEEPAWWVEKSLFKGTEALAEETKVTKPFRLALTIERHVAATIVCKVVRLKGAQIENTDERSEKAVLYEKCEVEGGPECKVKEPVETAPLKARLEGPTGAIRLHFVLQSGTEIANYHLKGCLTTSLNGEYKTSGEMICNYSGVEREKEEHPLEFTATSGSKVKVNGEPTEFVGTDEVHLASRKLWSALD
jgi:hypothetical protein